MLEIVNIRNQIKTINTKAKDNTLDPIHIQTLITLVRDLKLKFDASANDVYILKSNCTGFLRAFDSTTQWKDINVLAKPGIQAGNILVLSREFVRDPGAAMKEYGSTTDVKGLLKTLLTNLISALTAALRDVELTAAVRNVKIARVR